MAMGVSNESLKSFFEHEATKATKKKHGKKKACIFFIFFVYLKKNMGIPT